ncbi:hypothetical protein GXN76_12915 [Kroppenstedtia pulmonis]|uniref:Uncharacterized protein n=1 Tax=Kroppenstedtia pulmonis TaxID=1380685 RepID=A0A7D3Y617_9BACL|nr:hypothetical protein [Kroppenstedtia pulmonis]QKG85285.1 hypothetical protein GXN76_12915 [Kroppenstedtia pulmonis]
MSQSEVLSKNCEKIEVMCGHYQIKERFGTKDAKELLYRAIADHVNREMGQEVLIKKHGLIKGKGG